MKKRRKRPSLKVTLPGAVRDDGKPKHISPQVSLKLSPSGTVKNSPIKLLCKHAALLDFDKCLLKDHISGRYEGKFNYDLPSFNIDDFAISNPQEALNSLLDDHPDAGIAIVSFGIPSIIQAAVEWLLNEKFKKAKRYTVITPASCISAYRSKHFQDDEKIPLFQKLLKETGIPAGNMIYFDDTEKHVKSAQDLGIEQAFVAKPFNDDHLERVREFFKQKNNMQQIY